MTYPSDKAVLEICGGRSEFPKCQSHAFQFPTFSHVEKSPPEWNTAGEGVVIFLDEFSRIVQILRPGSSFPPHHERCRARRCLCSSDVCRFPASDSRLCHPCSSDCNPILPRPDKHILFVHPRHNTNHLPLCCTVFPILSTASWTPFRPLWAPHSGSCSPEEGGGRPFCFATAWRYSRGGDCLLCH